MKTDPAILLLVPRLIEALRHELHQYGEMLALLDQQQEQVMGRAADEVLHSAVAINDQMAVLQLARRQREACQGEVARALHQPEETTFVHLIPQLPEQYRSAVEALVRENNELLTRVQRRGRQNHVLLSRSLEMMQRFMSTLLPASPPTVYNGEGHLHPASPQTQPIYEAVG